MDATETPLVPGASARGTQDDQTLCPAHPPEVKAHEKNKNHRHNRRVDGIKTGEDCRPHLRAALEGLFQPIANQGDILQHAGADGNGPEPELVPRQEIPCKGRDENRTQEAEPYNPVELPRCSKSTGEKNPQKMQKNHKKQDGAAPVMDVAYQLSEKNVLLQVCNGFIGPEWRWLVGKFKQDAGAREGPPVLPPCRRVPT